MNHKLISTEDLERLIDLASSCLEDLQEGFDEGINDNPPHPRHQKLIDKLEGLPVIKQTEEKPVVDIRQPWVRAIIGKYNPQAVFPAEDLDKLWEETLTKMIQDGSNEQFIFNMGSDYDWVIMKQFNPMSEGEDLNDRWLEALKNLTTYAIDFLENN
jgi:hypothetical protein